VVLPEDPFIRELLPEFIDTWIEDLEHQFAPAIENRNSQDLYRLGHTLKGSCFQFGLDQIANMGIELMGYAKEENWDLALILVPKIKSEFSTVKIEIDSLNN
jgi:hypothetical protein